MKPPILFIEDEVDIVELFSIGLRKLGYPILAAHNGDTALKLLEENTPALVILDIAMPYPSGLDLLRHIRNDARLSGTKVVLFTAVPSRLTKNDIDLADAMLTKPTTPRLLEQAITNLMGE